MASTSVETRLAVVEHEQQHITSRLDRETASRSDIQSVRTELESVRTEMHQLHTSTLRWVVATPAMYLAVIWAGLRLLQWAKDQGFVS